MRRFFDRQTIHEFSDEEIMLELCRRIRLLRQGSGISQTDMANEAGVSLSTVRRIESGDAGNVTLTTLLKILRAGGSLEGVADLVVEVPTPEFKEDKRGYFSKKNRKQ